VSGEVLRLIAEIWRMDVGAAQRRKAMEDENRRLQPLVWVSTPNAKNHTLSPKTCPVTESCSLAR